MVWSALPAVGIQSARAELCASGAVRSLPLQLSYSPSTESRGFLFLLAVGSPATVFACLNLP